MTPREQLIAAFQSNNLVVVLGAGVTSATTAQAATSTWGGLLKDGAERLKAINPEQAALVELNLDGARTATDYANIAGMIRRELGDNFGRWLDIAIGRLLPVNPAVIEAVGSLGAPILTTNYDDLAERILGRGSASWGKPDEMLRTLREPGGKIGHLHGVWNDRDSVIFSIEDYARIRSHQDAQATQSAAFKMKTFLFVGVGEGLEDPNFDPLVKDFTRLADSNAATHFRLCRDEDVDAATELESIVDVGFGPDYDDLAPFLAELASTVNSPTIDIQRRARERLLDFSRDNSTMWRESETLNDKTFDELVVPPTFLPEPHDHFATSVVNNGEKNRPEPTDIDESIDIGGILLVAGDENSGVTTAVNYCLNRAMDKRPETHSILVDKPLAQGFKRIESQLRRTYRDWGIETDSNGFPQGLILGIDNLRVDGSPQFNRAIEGIRDNESDFKIVGVRQADVASVVEALKNAGVDEEIQVVYVGRFSNNEALELARRIAPERPERVATNVMIIIKQKNLPRTPFTITLLIELILSGAALDEQESELAVLDKYIDLLLRSEFLKSDHDLKMNLRNKRKILELLAQHFVEREEDQVSEGDLLSWLSANFAELGWSHSPSLCMNDLITRRVLSRRAGGSIGFQRSTYLELMAGNSAKADSNFRSVVLTAPIALAKIVRTYAAMTRDDEEVLRVLETVLDELPDVDINGRVFGAVKKITPRQNQEALSDRSEAESSASPTSPNEAIDSSENDEPALVYDDSDDSDSPAFLLTRVEDLPEWRRLMLTIDLASRVLRDSDEVRNQELKERLLGKVLSTWVEFIEMYEREVTGSTELDDLILSFLDEQEDSEEELKHLRSFFNTLLPSVLASSGIQYCLSGPSLVARLAEIDPETANHSAFTPLIRTVALYGAGGTEWIASLAEIQGAALKSFFCTTYIAGIARYAFVTDHTLDDNDQSRLREFLRRIITERYEFNSLDQKVRTTNTFEDKLSRKRLNFIQKRKTAAMITKG